MKKVLALVFALMMVFSCIQIAAAEEPIEIEFFQHKDEAEVDIFDEMIQVFEAEHPGIKIKQVHFPEEEADTILSTRIQNNDAPDIWNTWFSQEVFTQADEGIILDLTGSEILEPVSEKALNDTAYNGRNYMIPVTSNFMGVFYNKTLFDEKGYKIPETPEEFWALCEQIKADGLIPIAAGDMDGWNLAHWIQSIIGEYMPNYSAEFLKIYDGEMTVAEMEGIEDVADIIVKRSQYVQDGPLGADSSAMLALFVNGEAAMMANGSYWIPSIDAAEPDFEYAVFPFPGRTKEETLVQSNADLAFVISAKASAEKQEAAKTFLSWITHEGAKIYIDATGAPSCLKNITPDTSKYSLIAPYLEEGKIFRMPYSGRWADNTYLDYTVAVQNLTDTGDKEAFYSEFNDALVNNGKPETYVD